MAKRMSNGKGWLTLLFATTLFLSAFLLFWIQPLIAKMLLPLLAKMRRIGLLLLDAGGILGLWSMRLAGDPCHDGLVRKSGQTIFRTSSAFFFSVEARIAIFYPSLEGDDD